MYEEDKLMRTVIIQNELLKCKPFLEEQNIFGKIFSNMLQYIQNPSNILSRLRFMMGERFVFIIAGIIYIN